MYEVNGLMHFSRMCLYEKFPSMLYLCVHTVTLCGVRSKGKPQSAVSFVSYSKVASL